MRPTNMTKLTEAEQIRQLAREEAKNLIDVANATAAALATSTKESISSIQMDIKEINAKLDGRFVQKEEFENFSKQSSTQRNDHEARLRSLEVWKWVTWAGIIILGFLITTASNIFGGIKL